MRDEIGQRVDPGRQEPYEPTPEDYAGELLPGGRGTELHGVPWVPDREDDGKGERWVQEYEEPEREVEPIPVRVVQEHGRSERHWRVFRTVLTAGVTAPVVGRQETRSALLVKVVSGSCYVGDELNNASAYGGFPLSVGDTFSTDAVTAVYGYSAAGAELAVLQSFEVER